MMRKKLEEYRTGAIGSLLDEYERAVGDLKMVLAEVSTEAFTKIADANTKDEDCRSIETIMNHVLRAGHGYVRLIRTALAMDVPAAAEYSIAKSDLNHELDRMVGAAVAIFEERPGTTDEEITELLINSRWGVVYNIDQMLEHAIVHVLRHRRQIEKFVLMLETA